MSLHVAKATMLFAARFVSVSGQRASSELPLNAFRSRELSKIKVAERLLSLAKRTQLEAAPNFA